MKNIIFAMLFLNIFSNYAHGSVFEKALNDEVITLKSESTKRCASAGGEHATYNGKPIVQRHCNGMKGQKWSVSKENNSGISDAQQAILKAAYLEASQGWVDAFNAGDPVAVANWYEDTAIMDVKSLLDFGMPVAGVRVGIAEIEDFYSLSFNTFGLTDAKYIQPKITLIDDNTVAASAHVTLNKVGVYIHSEIWALQGDGSMKLKYDEFSIRYFR